MNHTLALIVWVTTTKYHNVDKLHFPSSNVSGKYWDRPCFGVLLEEDWLFRRRIFFSRRLTWFYTLCLNTTTFTTMHRGLEDIARVHSDTRSCMPSWSNIKKSDGNRWTCMPNPSESVCCFLKVCAVFLTFHSLCRCLWFKVGVWLPGCPFECSVVCLVLGASLASFWLYIWVCPCALVVALFSMRQSKANAPS